MALQQLKLTSIDVDPRLYQDETWLMGPPQRLYSNFIRGIRSLPARIVN